MISHDDIFSYLEEKHDKYNRVSFIETDPISIPHQFSKKEDIEISAFLTSIIAWGQRKTIINNANKLMRLMGISPFDFVMNANQKDLKKFLDFKHRTFNGNDCIYFIRSLQNIYKNHGGLELSLTKNEDFKASISNFKVIFFELPYQQRTTKHISNPNENSAAKRINMFLRWMIRKDKRGVDFGIWKASPSLLFCPLDIHSGSVARKLGVLKRNQNDWSAVHELTSKLRTFDAFDPVKYDFALFGLGAFESF